MKQCGVVEENTQQNPTVVQVWLLAVGKRLQALFAQAALEQRHSTSVVGDQIVLSVPTRHGTTAHRSVAGILMLEQASASR